MPSAAAATPRAWCTIGVVLQDVMERLAELTAAGGEKVPGLSTGFSAVDSKINGLNDSDLLLLAARPGMGKTSMALNVALICGEGVWQDGRSFFPRDEP